MYDKLLNHCGNIIVLRFYGYWGTTTKKYQFPREDTFSGLFALSFIIQQCFCDQGSLLQVTKAAKHKIINKNDETRLGM